MWQILLNTSPILLAMLLGYLSRSQKWLPLESKSTLAFLAFKLIVPFLVIKSFSGVIFDANNFGVLLGVLIILGILYLLTFLLAGFLKLPKSKMGVILSCLPTFAIGPFVYPFVMVNYTDEILVQVVLIDIVQILSILTISYWLAFKYSDNGKLSNGEVGRKLITNPVIISLLIVMSLNYIGIKIPDEVIKFSDFFAKSFGFLAAFFVGFILDFTKLTNIGNSIFIVFFRVLAAGLIVYTLIKTGLVPQSFATAMYLCFLAPIATLPSIFAHEAKLDEAFVSSLTLLSYILAIFLYPIVLVILN